MNRTKAKRLLVAVAMAGMPLAMMASCDPYDGTLSVFRERDHDHHGIFDLFIEGDVHFDDCLFIDCYYDDDYYYEGIVIFD